jgi:hypothetical protein
MDALQPSNAGSKSELKGSKSELKGPKSELKGSRSELIKSVLDVPMASESPGFFAGSLVEGRLFFFIFLF